MPAIRKLPDSATLRRLRTQGYTQRDIAETYNATVNAEPAATYKDVLPWEISDEHKGTAIMERFRAIVKRNKGAVLRPDEETLLNIWLRELEAENLVVNYHPDAPPNSASSRGGFYYVPKSEQDDWIIRRPITPS